MKIEFLMIFGKVVAKNRAFGNNIIFQQQFFPFRGGAFPMFAHTGGAYDVGLCRWLLLSDEEAPSSASTIVFTLTFGNSNFRRLRQAGSI